MNCQEYKNWLKKRGESDDEAAASEASSHAASCPECAALDRIDLVLEDKIKMDLSMREVPEALLQKIELNIKLVPACFKQGSASGLKRKASILWKAAAPALAMAAAALLFISFNLKYFKSIEEVGRLSVESHMENLPMMFNANEVKDVGLWFKDKLSFPVSFPSIEDAGLKLIGGRRCKLGRNDVAYLLYNKGDKRISLYVMDTANIKYEMEDNKKYHFPFKDCEVDIWKSGKTVYSMVR